MNAREVEQAAADLGATRRSALHCLLIGSGLDLAAGCAVAVSDGLALALGLGALAAVGSGRGGVASAARAHRVAGA